MNRVFNVIRNPQAAFRNASIAAVGALPVLSMAQATDPFTTAMTTATTKVETYATALVTLAAVAVIFMIGIKYVKKIPKAS